MTIAITLFGLGIMGRPIARTLIKGGIDVRGWNRSPLPENLTAGIPWYQNLEEAAQADVCLLLLKDSVAVDAVLGQLEPHLSGGQIILDMGSSDPTHSEIHAGNLAARGIGWVDAPVSGGPEGAETGTLSIMAGGSSRDVDRVRPVLDVLGTNIVHVGRPGMGHVVK